MVRNMLFLFTLLINLAVILPLWSQSKTLTLEEAVSYATTSLAPDKFAEIQWIADGDYFTYLHDSSVFRQRGDQKDPDRLFDLERLNSWLNDAGLPGQKKQPKLQWRDQKNAFFWHGDSLIRIMVDDRKTSFQYALQPGNEKRDFNVNSKATAYVYQQNLYVHPENSAAIPVTEDSLQGIVNGDDVHRREFGIRKGIFWAPSGEAVAFYRKDERMVTDYPYVDYKTRPATLKAEKYPMAGMDNHETRIGVFHIDQKKLIWLETGKRADQYLTNITWSPDEKNIYVAHINRDQNHLRMARYQAATGKQLNIVFEESDENYLDPQVGPYFAPENPRLFYWLSQRNGWNHLYAYRSDGTPLGAKTSGKWDVTEFLGFERHGKAAYFAAANPDPTQRTIYRLNRKDGSVTRVMSRNGTNDGTLSANGKYLVNEFSSLSIPGITSLIDLEENLERILLRSDNPLKDYRIGQTKLLPFALFTGDSVMQRIIYPPAFDEQKKYPLIVYVYGGPHSQQVRDTWLGGLGRWPLWLNYLATQGYVVMTVDNHGTYYRGKAFEQATFRRLGTLEVIDQASAVRSMAEKDYIDESRIGVVGWSYGGFMATSLMLREPDLFKTGIAGAPVIDWKYYETVYTERYMDTPASNAEGYKESSTLSYVDQLKGNLLLIHGTADPVVMWQNTIVFLQETIKAGVQTDYFVYPGHLHGITGKDKVHLYQKMTGYFHTHLKGGN